MTAPLRTGDPIIVDVALGERAYDIVIGRGLLATLGERIAKLRPGRKVAIVTDETVARHHLAAAQAALAGAGIGVVAVVVPAGESTKSFRHLEQVCDALLAARIERGDLVVALGGGVVGDLAGFAARSCGAASITCRCRPRCWRRSIPRSAARPRSTPATARTWSARSTSRSWCSPTRRCSTRCRSASSAPAMPRWRNTGCSATPNSSPGSRRTGATCSPAARAREHAIAVSCRAKAAIVARDERETGDRVLLNLGHTFGHALEAAAGFSDRLLHGEAVALGMALAFEFSARRGLMPQADAERVIAHLAAVGLPTHVKAVRGGNWPTVDALMDLIAQDKKVQARQADLHPGARHRPGFVARDVEAGEVRAFLAEKLGAQ